MSFLFLPQWSSIGTTFDLHNTWYCAVQHLWRQCFWISLWSRIGCRVAPIFCKYCSSTISYSRASTVFWSADSVSFPSSSNQLWSAYISVHTRRRLHDLKWDDRVVGWRGSVWWLHCAAHRGGWCLIYYSPPLPTYAIICTTAKWFTFANTYHHIQQILLFFLKGYLCTVPDL